MPQNDVTIEAQWKKSDHNYKIVDTPGTISGYSSALTGTISTQGSLVLPSAAQWTRTGYPLKGWTVTYSGGSSLPTDTTLAPGAIYIAP